MTKHIKLTKEQEEFIKARFVRKELLYDHVIEFNEEQYTTEIVFSHSDEGICVNQGYMKDLEWFDAFPKHIYVEFKKEV